MAVRSGNYTLLQRIPKPGSVAPARTAGRLPSAADPHPDCAVFLTYRGGNPPFAIQYVEGWQVAQTPDGLVIRDKDSSETVTVAALPSSVAAYISSTDLPSLQSQAGYKLVNARPVTAHCRTRKSANEIALMQRAKDMTLEVHKAAAANRANRVFETLDTRPEIVTPARPAP